MLRFFVILTLFACSTPAPTRQEVVQGATDLQSSLDQSAIALADGQIERARDRWRNAHLAWKHRVGPGLEPHMSHSQHLRLEHRLALVREAMESESGSMQQQVALLKQDLTVAMDRLP